MAKSNDPKLEKNVTPSEHDCSMQQIVGRLAVFIDHTNLTKFRSLKKSKPA